MVRCRERWVSGSVGAPTRIVFGAMDDGRWRVDDGRWTMMLFGDVLPSFAGHGLVRMGIGGRRHQDTSSWLPCRLADRCALSSAGSWANGAACADAKGWV